MCCYSHLTIDEREVILKLHGTMSVRKIAEKLGRSASTIAREINRNTEKDLYSANVAQKKYLTRRKKSTRRLILKDKVLLLYIIKHLEKGWSPEQIAGRLALEKGKRILSHNTIYRGFINKCIPGNLTSCLRKRGRKGVSQSKGKRGRIHGYKKIHQRPTEANNRERIGDWECDTVRGALNKGCIATFVDRKSRLLLAVRMNDRKASTLTNAMIELFKDFPPSLRCTFTVDHGNEFFSYKTIEEKLQADVFFADPYCSWQRGTNENTNGLIRQYFPKKFDFKSTSDSRVFDVVSILNSRPRKILGFKTPLEVFSSLCCT